jgi:tetratricopeptide (TPR) repeat protein
MALTKRPILSYLYAIDATRNVGTQKRTRQLFDQAIGIDAHSVVIREMYMVALQTAWGGSQKAMRDLLENARAAGLPDSRLRILESVIVADQAWVYNFNDHNYDAAAKAYLKSYDLNPEASCLKCAAAAFLDAHEPDRAREIFNRLLALNPSDTEAMVRRGWVDINNGRSQDGLADIQHAANLKDALGEYSLGELYLQGRVVPYDKDKGLALVKLAAAQNYLPATSMLDAISKGLWPSRVNPPQ